MKYINLSILQENITAPKNIKVNTENTSFHAIDNSIPFTVRLMHDSILAATLSSGRGIIAFSSFASFPKVNCEL